MNEALRRPSESGRTQSEQPGSTVRAVAGAPKSRARVFSLTAGDDYTACFYAALARIGIEVKPAQWSLRWLAATVGRGDIVHFHWPSFLYYDQTSRVRTWANLLRFTATLMLLRARGARVVWTAHNLYPHDGGRAVLAHRVARRLVVAVASQVCVHGRGAAEQVKREFGVRPERLVLLEHGNWIGFFSNKLSRREARQRLGIGVNEFVYLFVGLCKPYKNLERLVASHSALEDDSSLWIVGRFQSSAYRAQVDQVVRGSKSGRVTIRDGLVEPEDFQTYLNACDAVVLPYREVLTSGAVMLALSFGRPVVAPRMGTLAEVVTSQCGVLYPPEEQAGLLEAMRSAQALSFDPKLIVDRAQEFSWDRSAETFAVEVLQQQAD